MAGEFGDGRVIIQQHFSERNGGSTMPTDTPAPKRITYGELRQLIADIQLSPQACSTDSQIATEVARRKGWSLGPGQFHRLEKAVRKVLNTSVGGDQTPRGQRTPAAGLMTPGYTERKRLEHVNRLLNNKGGPADSTSVELSLHDAARCRMSESRRREVVAILEGRIKEPSPQSIALSLLDDAFRGGTVSEARRREILKELHQSSGRDTGFR